MMTSKSDLSHTFLKFIVASSLRLCAALILALMFSVTGVRAQSVNAGLDRTVNAGESVTLRATKSGIPNVGSSYIWGPNIAEDTAFVGISIVNNQITPDLTFIAPTGLTEDRVLVWKVTLVHAGVDPFFFEDTVTITVMAGDITIPVISLQGDAAVSIERGTTYTDAGATAQDDRDDDITSDIVITNPVDTDTASIYTITYNVMDAAGNAAVEVTRTVTVTLDVVIPVITLNGPASVLIERGTTYTDAGATAQDDRDGDRTDDIVTVSAVDTDTVGSYAITYNVMDTTGNRAVQLIRIVTVTLDATAPTAPTAPTVLSEMETDGRPGVAPATTDSTGKTITLPTSEEVNIGNAESEDFTVTSTLNDNRINHVVTNVRTGSIILDVSPTIQPGASIAVSYNPGGGRSSAAITDLSGNNDLVSFVDLPVKNVVTTAPAVEERVQKTVDTINRFLHARTNLILANRPSVSRRINRLQQGVGSERLSFATGELTKLKPFEFNFLSLGTGNHKLATSLDQVTRAADHLQVTQGGTAYHERRRFDVWFEGSLHKFSGSEGSGGDFGIAYLGADYLVSPDLLLGALLQYDSLSDSNASQNYTIEGKGWMAGPYVTARLRENLYLDARLAWGTSDNEISPQGSYTDSFKSTRWLTDISLSGEFTQGQWILRPNASLSWLADRQKAYTNTLGVIIPSQTVSSGQLRFGPNISTQFLGTNGWLYEPSFTLDAIYNHAGTSGGLWGTTPAPQDGWRARLEAGLAMTTAKGARLSIIGNYDGIGQSGFKAWGLGLNVNMKF